MNLYLCQYRHKFNFYDIQSGRFEYDESLSLPDLQQVVYRGEGEAGLRELPGRIERTKSEARLRDVLFCNRAGEDSKHLTVEECIEFFLS